MVMQTNMENKMESQTLDMGKLQMKTLCIAALLLVGSIAVAAPVVIDFDDTLPTYIGLETYQEDGFTLISNQPDGTLIDQNDIVRNNIGIFSGGTSSQSLFWGANGANSTISIVADSGLRFSIDSLDASSLYNVAGDLTLTGTKAGGGTVSQTLTLNGDLTSYNVTGLGLVTNLVLSFDGSVNDAPYDVDNISLNAVPVPAAVWLFASALGMLGWLRRSVKQ
jgi:hypothetical protein